MRTEGHPRQYKCLVLASLAFHALEIVFEYFLTSFNSPSIHLSAAVAPQKPNGGKSDA